MPNIHDTFKKDMESFNRKSDTSNTEDAVVDLIRSRGRAGKAKYGTTMDRTDLRPDQWIQHFQEELADGLQYAERIKGCGQLLEDARTIMLAIVNERHWECANDWIERHDGLFQGVEQQQR